MLKGFARNTYLVLGSVSVSSAVSDEANHDSLWYNVLPSFFYREGTLSSENVKNKSDLTGWDRLFIMFSRDEFGHLSKELNAVLYASYTTFFVGGGVGIAKNSKKAFHEFIERNQATQFANAFEARKTLQNKVLLASFRGLITYGSKLTFFTGSTLLITVSLMVYNNGMSVFHYGIAGGIMGSLYRWKMGTKGMLAGGIVGGTLGIIGGGLTKVMFYLTNTRFEEILSYQDEIIRSRERQFSEIKKSTIDSNTPFTSLLKEHDEIVKAEEVEKKVVPSSSDKDK
ncbi:RPII140-upstream gene protein [Lycorma delicatula]|uniref:RPII140-upstream gene protein n=1 Tax=Lycorma delicatula TaxID=130591 RepID=UPI003F5174B6